MDEKKVKIIQDASMVFMRNGIKSVTMDDMARHLGISKKTLYKYVKDKTDLVEQVVSSLIHFDACCMDKISEKDLNAIDEMFEIAEFILQQISNMHPSIMFDMEKYYPSANKLIKDHHKEHVYGEVLNNLKHGMKEGLYRENLNPEIIATVYTLRMKEIWDSSTFDLVKFKHEDVFKELIRYHLRGVASQKGIEYLNEKQKTNNINL